MKVEKQIKSDLDNIRYYAEDIAKCIRRQVADEGSLVNDANALEYRVRWSNLTAIDTSSHMFAVYCAQIENTLSIINRQGRRSDVSATDSGSQPPVSVTTPAPAPEELEQVQGIEVEHVSTTDVAAATDTGLTPADTP